MFLAEDVATNINWTLICGIVLTAATVAMWWDARKQRSTRLEQPVQVSGTPPSADVIANNLKQLNHRMRALEDWRDSLLQKMDEDKTTILAGGEDRARRIYAHIEDVRKELDGKLSSMPSEIVTLLRNTGNLKH